MTYFDPAVPEGFLDAQIACAEAFQQQAVQEAEAEAAAEAATAERKRKEDTEAARKKTVVARKPVSIISTGKGVPDLPTRSRVIPAAAPAPRRTSHTGMAGFLKGALAVTNAVLKAENAMNGNVGGGSGGGGGGGGNLNFNSNGNGNNNMDMNSFWAPINSAANDQIQ